MLSISRNYVVTARRGFFFLLVLGQAALFYFGPRSAFHIIKLPKVQILGTCWNCCTFRLFERVHTISRPTTYAGLSGHFFACLKSFFLPLMLLFVT